MHPTEISLHMEADKIAISLFLGSLTDSTGQQLPHEKTLVVAMPNQMPSESQLEDLEALITVLILTNLIIIVPNLLLVTSHTQLWSYINVLQLITHLPLLAISVPGNATLYLRHMMDVATFEILPVEATWAIFNLPPQEPYSDSSSRAGYTHQYMFENSRTATLLIHLFIPLAVVFALISLVTDKRVTVITKHPRVTKCRHSLLFGGSLRLWCELYLRIAVSASIGLLTMRWSHM